MKTRPIFSLFFSLFSLFFFSQQKKQDTVKAKWKYETNFMIGVDVLNASTGFFSDRQLLQGFISSKIKGNIHGLLTAGFDKNTYQKNGYDVKANGPFAGIGAFYMLAKDRENEFNGFYAGGKIAGSFYRQEYLAIPVRGYGGSTASISMAPSSQSSFWIEGLVGGRVQLFESDFYIDVNIQPRFLIITSKQDEVIPMIVPGFGRSSNKFNIGFAWNLAYKF